MDLAKLMPPPQDNEEDDNRDIVVIGYTNVGAINGIGQSTIQVEAREVLVPDRNIASYSVRVELSSGGDYPKESFATISYKDIDRMIAASRRLETINISVDRFALSEVQFELSDLKMIVFNTHQGSMMAAIQANGNSVHLSSPSKISSFTHLLEKAKLHLDANKLP